MDAQRHREIGELTIVAARSPYKSNLKNQAPGVDVVVKLELDCGRH
jgi:hypothetical protein